MLAAHVDSVVLRSAVEAAYNPFKRFGVLNVPAKASPGEATFGNRHWQIDTTVADDIGRIEQQYQDAVAGKVLAAG